MGDPPFPKAMASHSAPEPLPSAASKRRWSPCTWRYAIEEGQPELGSKPRSSYILSSPSSAPRDRDRPSDPPKKPSSPGKTSDVPQSSNRDQIPVEQSPSRQSAERGGPYKKQGQRGSEEMEDGAKKSTNQKKVTESHEERRRRRKNKEICRRRVEKEGQPGDASKRRTKREMTPSELYFCEVCAARVSNGSGSPVGDCC